MAARVFDLEVEQGADYILDVPCLDGNDDPQDVTGWTVRGQIRVSHRSTVKLADISIEASGTNVTITIDSTTSASWEFRSAVYDVELVNLDGFVSRLLKGRVIIDPEVTR